ncbi:MAG: phage integrase N-terminal SAM-like domain-containing protein [Acidobacteriota bacterium]
MSAQPPQLPKFLDQVRNAIRLRRMSYHTEQTYCDWIKRFILFHNKRHPAEITFHFPYSICHLLFVIEAGNVVERQRKEAASNLKDETTAKSSQAKAENLKSD